MKVLGIESTAHTFGAGIADGKGNILANEKEAYRTREGGIHPGQAARQHYWNAPEVIARSLEKGKVKLEELDGIAFAQGPGLGPCLRVGALAARTLARIGGLPLIGVNHCVSHFEIGKLKTGARDPLIVFSSGANTQVLALNGGRYRVYGETLDVGIGNLLDTFGRELGMGFPAGPELDKLYFEGKKYVELPYTVKGTDLAFSGLLTAATLKIGKERIEDLAYSLLHTAFAMLTEVTERALAHSEKKEVLVIGGVASSKALRGMLGKMCEEREARLFAPEPQYCVDNGAMIAWNGVLALKAGCQTPIGKSLPLPFWRPDQVDVSWGAEEIKRKKRK